jgi:enolase
MKVKDLKLREILATNCQKTIEVELETDKVKARASAPIGTSRSRSEVVYLPIEELKKEFPNIKRRFVSQSFASMEELDHFLKFIDKTSNFRKIGGNLALCLSSAFLKAFALEQGKEVFEFLSKEKKSIPLPICNVAGGWKGQSDIQEFLFLPVHQKSFLENISKIARAYYQLGIKLREKDNKFNFGKNIESAWLTSLDFERLLEILTEIATENELKIGLDVAASQLWDGKNYVYKSGETLARMEQLGLMEQLTRKYPIVYIEDPFSEEDFVSFATLTHRLQNKLVIGDDLFSTDLNKLRYGISYKAANGIIIKPSQVGTITDTIKVIEEAKKNNIKTIVSHRSGETDDTLICHLAVGMNSDYIKIGISGERTTKINEIIRIEELIPRS